MKITNKQRHSITCNTCYSFSCYVLNGRLDTDKICGATTCRNASIVDYFICDTKRFPFTVYLHVDDFCPLLSDVHKPVILQIDFDLRDTWVTNHDNTNNDVNAKLWDREHPEYFEDNIDIIKVSEIETMLNMLAESEEIESSDVDHIATQISNVFSQKC